MSTSFEHSLWAMHSSEQLVPTNPVIPITLGGDCCNYTCSTDDVTENQSCNKQLAQSRTLKSQGQDVNLGLYDSKDFVLLIT